MHYPMKGKVNINNIKNSSYVTEHSIIKISRLIMFMEISTIPS
jgi:hypothetical protein